MILKSVIRDIHVRRKWRDSSIQSLFKFSLVSYLSNDIPADMVWYGMVWYGMVWYGMVWYGMVWCIVDKTPVQLDIKTIIIVCRSIS